MPCGGGFAQILQRLKFEIFWPDSGRHDYIRFRLVCQVDVSWTVIQLRSVVACSPTQVLDFVILVRFFELTFLNIIWREALVLTKLFAITQLAQSREGCLTAAAVPACFLTWVISTHQVRKIRHRWVIFSIVSASLFPAPISSSRDTIGT